MSRCVERVAVVEEVGRRLELTLEEQVVVLGLESAFFGCRSQFRLGRRQLPMPLERLVQPELVEFLVGQQLLLERTAELQPLEPLRQQLSIQHLAVKRALLEPLEPARTALVEQAGVAAGARTRHQSSVLREVSEPPPPPVQLPRSMRLPLELPLGFSSSTAWAAGVAERLLPEAVRQQMRPLIVQPAVRLEAVLEVDQVEVLRCSALAVLERQGQVQERLE